MSNELKPLHFDADYTMEEALAEAPASRASRLCRSMWQQAHAKGQDR